MSTSAILVNDGQALPPVPLLTTIFEQQVSLPRPVAMRLAGRARWIVWEDAPHTSAQAVADGLSSAGYRVAVVAQSDVVPTLTPRRVHIVKPEVEALGLQLKYSGPLEHIAWPDVLVLSAGAIREEKTKTEHVEVDLGRQGKYIETRTKVDITRTILADLYVTTASGSLLYVRLHCQEVNYAQSIGASAHESWRDKFAVLVARLGLCATSAAISPQTEALLAAGMVPDACTTSAYFADEDEFAIYNRWLATRKRLGLA